MIESWFPSLTYLLGFILFAQSCFCIQCTKCCTSYLLLIFWNKIGKFREWFYHISTYQIKWFWSDLAGLLKFIADFTCLLILLFIVVIRSGWEIFRFILAWLLLIVHPMKSYSSPIDQSTYYFLIHLIVSINCGLSMIASVSYT